jgi:uncharacterized membrane protein YccF (DUF307 family)
MVHCMPVKTIGNLLWLVLAGLWLAIGYVIAGVLNCITIIGIPFGLQSFKLVPLALAPFGKEVGPVSEAVTPSQVVSAMPAA